MALLAATPLRVTTWDLQPRVAIGTNRSSTEFQRSLILDAAESLKKQHPDVVLLQHAPGWQTCQQLAQALQPEVYQVAACSAWRGQNGQAAILSKAKAYLSWSEPWKNGGGPSARAGGFAFAAIQFGGKNIGILSVQTGDEYCRQIARQITALQKWKINRLDVYLVAGDFNATTNAFVPLEQLGFKNAFAELPPKITAPNVEHLFTLNASLASPPLTERTSQTEHDAMTCEIDLSAPKIAAKSLPPAPESATPSNSASSVRNARIWWLAAVPVCVLLFFVVRKIAQRPALPPASAHLVKLNPQAGPPYVQVETEGSSQTQSQSRMPAAVRASLMADLTRWLKQAIVRRLVSDRAQLLATQQAAALKVQAVDARLAKIEHQIHERNQDYERRIDELLKALITAEEENRELIRAQITLLKAEMENSRLKREEHSDERFI